MNGYNEETDYTIYAQWLTPGLIPDDAMNAYVDNLACRYLLQRRDAQAQVVVYVELKDEGIKTGEYARLLTDEIVNTDGSDSNYTYQVVEREPQTSSDSTTRQIALTLQKTAGRIAYFALPARPRTAWLRTIRSSTDFSAAPTAQSTATRSTFFIDPSPRT